MVREIIFRGKHIHAILQNKHLDGRWVYGYPCDENYINTVDGDEYGQEFMSEMLIDPETIGQYTGVPDKNKTKIFEGDIVKRKLSNGYIIGIVVWLDIGVCGFYLKCKNSYYPIGKEEHTGIAVDDEVIGNIFDNPELLEEDNE